MLRTRTGTLVKQMVGRGRIKSKTSFCVRVKETAEHMIVKCVMYKEERRELKEKVTSIIHEEEWYRKLEQEDREP